MHSVPLEVKVYRTIHEVSQKEWDSINAPEDGFHAHSFLKDIEDARVEGSDLWYLMLYRDRQLISTAVLSAFMINLDIFIGAGAFINGLRKLWPGFLKIKVLMCGIPASFGQKNIVVKDNRDTTDSLQLIAKSMEKIAREEKIKYLAFKEFKEKEVTQYDSLKRYGYFKALSLPNMRLELRWKDFDSYLAAFRHGYRRQIRASLSKINNNFVFSPMKGRAHGSSLPSVVVTDAAMCSPELFYESYLEVMKRATSRLETFNLDFFRRFFLSHREKLVFMVIKDTSMIHGAAILVPQGKALTFALLGKKTDKDDYDTYFNLLVAIVKYAIENNFEFVNMGQTSYYPKLRVGAKPVNEYIYFRSHSRTMHALLKASNKLVFPVTKIKDLKVFKSSSEGLTTTTH